MDAVTLARLQFGITTVYHFFFVPLSIGLAIFIAILETRYVKTGDEKLKRMVKFWGKLFMINFAMGVCTGIVQEFQFGMNWSSYSRYVGDIFGAPLAIEALLAFFIESTFLGLWLFGWDKLSKKVHCLCMWLAAFATTISAYWILTANSFMQNPVGYAINEEAGRAELTDFFALITNTHTFYQFGHVVTGAIATAGFFVLGVAGFQIARGRDTDVFGKAFKQGVVFALCGTILVAGIGHFQGQYLVREQPMKMAAAEAHWNTSDAPDFAVVAIPDKENGTNKWDIKIPGLLSIMSYHRIGQPVDGINDLQAEMEAMYGPGDYIPPVATSFYSFRIMIGVGCLMILLSLIAALLCRGDKFLEKKGFMKLLTVCIILPYIANTAGWLLAEIGRQPWIVYGLQTVYEAVSTVVAAPAVLLTLVLFTLIYAVLAVFAIYLAAKFTKEGMQPEPSDDDAKEEVKVLWT